MAQPSAGEGGIVPRPVDWWQDRQRDTREFHIFARHGATDTEIEMRFEFTVTGKSPLLMHYDDVEWADTTNEWLLNPENTKKKGESSGDDRRPAWKWIGYCYHDGKNLAIPGANLTACFKKAGARVPLGRQKTFKELAVSAIFIESEFLRFTTNGKTIPVAPIRDLVKVSEFRLHIQAVEKMGFRLFVKRAPVGQSKHVRVRARFDDWELSGTLEVLAHEITPDVLDSIFSQAGRVGLGDWRPGSPKSPGPFGMFTHTLKPIK